jgi:hypothetical protein
LILACLTLTKDILSFVGRIAASLIMPRSHMVAPVKSLLAFALA